MPLNAKDFIEVDFTGKLAETGQIFDTTIDEIAHTHNIPHNEHKHSITLCLGEGFLLKGLEQALIGKEVGEHTITLTPEHAFGKKNPKMISMVPTKKFTEQKIRPFTGLQVNIDGYVGCIRAVNGGRCIVDFNHPLSGKTITYDVTIKRKVDDKKEQLKSILASIGLKTEKIQEDKGAFTITTAQQIPEEVTKIFKGKITELTGIENLSFEASKTLNTQDNQPTSTPEMSTTPKE